MAESNPAFQDLCDFLDANSIGTSYLTPRPRGSPLSDGSRETLTRLLEESKAAAEVSSWLPYGNGCFAAQRYEESAGVYQAILEQQPDHLASRFNSGLTSMRLKQPGEAIEVNNQV